MKKTIFVMGALLNLTLVSTLGAWCCPQVERCSGRWFVGGFGGFNQTQKNGHKVFVISSTSTDPQSSSVILPHQNLHYYCQGYLTGVHGGYRWQNGFILEAELSYRFNKNKKKKNSDGVDHQAVAPMVNGLYQFNILSSPLDIFFGGGLGYVNTQNKKHHKSNGKRNGFAWQFIGGGAFAVNPKLDLNLEYRYFNEVPGKFMNSSVDLGFKFYF